MFDNIFNEMKCLAGINEDIFKPATKDELKQRKESYAQITINELVNRDDCTKHPDGSYSFKNSVDLSHLDLIEIPIKFKYVGGYFDCSHNKLISLKGAPKQVNGYFDCSHNRLISLQGSPKIVKGGFGCSNNKLITLKGAPKYVGGYFDCHNNKIKFTKNNVKKICNVKGRIYV